MNATAHLSSDLKQQGNEVQYEYYPVLQQQHCQQPTTTAHYHSLLSCLIVNHPLLSYMQRHNLFTTLVVINTFENNLLLLAIFSVLNTFVFKLFIIRNLYFITTHKRTFNPISIISESGCFCMSDLVYTQSGRFQINPLWGIAVSDEIMCTTTRQI